MATEKKYNYPFKADPGLVAEGKALAKAYRLSLNMLLTLLLESAVEEWSVPGTVLRDREGKIIDEDDSTSRDPQTING